MSTVLAAQLATLSPPEAARTLLGWRLAAGPCVAQIVEAEAYGGADDPGSHAWRGMTPRNRTMFGPPGRAYVYFTYGCHWMLNVVARPEGEPAALLVRAAQPLEGLAQMRARRPKARDDRGLLSGPGKLAAALELDGRHDGCLLFDPGSPLQLLPGEPAGPVLCGPRVGLSPGRGEGTPWRFVDAGRTEWCSRPLRTLREA